MEHLQGRVKGGKEGKREIDMMYDAIDSGIKGGYYEVGIVDEVFIQKLSRALTFGETHNLISPCRNRRKTIDYVLQSSIGLTPLISHLVHKEAISRLDDDDNDVVIMHLSYTDEDCSLWYW